MQRCLSRLFADNFQGEFRAITSTFVELLFMLMRRTAVHSPETRSMLTTTALALLLLTPVAEADRALPVQSITAFKDGHALVIREGQHEVKDGAILLDGLPSPLLGTFWPYATDEQNAVVSATASQIPTESEQVAATMVELLRENIGEQVMLEIYIDGKTQGKQRGVIEGVSSSGADQSYVLLKGDDQLQAIPTRHIEGLVLDKDAKTQVSIRGTTPGLRLKLKNGDVAEAGIGLMYVEKGFRWIPQYKMTLGPDGKAEYVLRATLVNDIIDIEDATVNLVVGVPTFAFAGQTDPISLNANVAQVVNQISNGNFRFSNAFQTQMLSNAAGAAYGGGITVEEAAPEMTGAKRSEDLYVFTVEHVTLKQGERMSIEVSRGTVEYEHTFEVALPVLPPAEIGNVNAQQKEMVAKLLQKPQVAHALKITNKNREPLTTAPTLLFTQSDEGQETLLAQSLQTYTPPGGNSRVDLGTAIEIAVQFEEEEIDRVSDSRKHGGYSFDRVNLKGKITVCNHRPEKSTLIVKRYVPGPLDAASDNGETKTLAPFDADSNTAGLSGGNITANWWYGYRPNWYSALNPVSRATWTLELEPEEVKEPTYEWHYFWRW